MTREQEKKIYKRVAFVGALLGMICHLLPPHYQAVCSFISNACTGHF